MHIKLVYTQPELAKPKFTKIRIRKNKRKKTIIKIGSSRVFYVVKFCYFLLYPRGRDLTQFCVGVQAGSFVYLRRDLCVKTRIRLFVSVAGSVAVN